MDVHTILCGKTQPFLLVIASRYFIAGFCKTSRNFSLRFSAGSILLVTVISIPLFKEYLDRRQTAALTLILTAIVLLNL